MFWSFCFYLNQYGYVEQNPISRLDADGLILAPMLRFLGVEGGCLSIQISKQEWDDGAVVHRDEMRQFELEENQKHYEYCQKTNANPCDREACNKGNPHNTQEKIERIWREYHERIDKNPYNLMSKICDVVGIKKPKVYLPGPNLSRGGWS